jgi:hypothetical protein
MPEGLKNAGGSFSKMTAKVLHYQIGKNVVGVSRPGVPGPTSEMSPRAPAQMGRHEAEREGGK